MSEPVKSYFIDDMIVGPAVHDFYTWLLQAHPTGGWHHFSDGSWTWWP